MLIEIQWHPTPKQLRIFGVGGLLASIVAALVLHFVWGTAAFWAILVVTAGAAICLCSLVSPAATRILYLGLTLVAMPIGFVVSLVLLAAFYFLLLTPVALVFRLIGRDALGRSWRGRPALACRGHRARDARARVPKRGLFAFGNPRCPRHEEQGQDGLATSYWVPHKPSEDMERYFHQF
jgi:hypothetical protein